MEMMTAEQAADAAKGLTFEKVWVALMESRQQMIESQQRIDESQQRIEKNITDLSKNIGGLGNSLGRLTEAMFSTELWKKFNELGFPFTKQGYHMKFSENEQLLAEADFFLENGEYAMPVEIKTDLSVNDVDEHLERITKIRQYMDMHGDNRKLVGTVAGGIVSENVLKYAQRKGLFVLMQTGDSVAVADIPQGFKAREW
ncbi:MAG: hypothetical protein FWF87_05135 [Synergistaceae bacterium]|nr:hypothetical protein [Synergistaceae bacterium]